MRSPVQLGPRQEPQPDLAIVRDRDYGSSLPGPEDILLLIEVSDTSLDYDREIKLPLYARAEIPEVWIVDLPGQALELYTEPSGSGYAVKRRVSKVTTLASPTLPTLELDPAGFLPG
ncbi:MAG: Uma2 family endonuclease [Rubrobacteraceae bacterium]